MRIWQLKKCLLRSETFIFILDSHESNQPRPKQNNDYKLILEAHNLMYHCHFFIRSQMLVNFNLRSNQSPLRTTQISMVVNIIGVTDVDQQRL